MSGPSSAAVVTSGPIFTTAWPPEHKGEHHRAGCAVYEPLGKPCNCDQGGRRDGPK